MATREYSQHQKQLIADYYRNRDNIMLQKLSELVTELYLAETPAKRDRLWKRVEKAMTNLKVKPALRKHIMQHKSVQILVKNLQDWQKNT